MITLTPVKSSNIEAIGHDPATREMHVRFSGGKTYVVHGVSPEQHAEFMAASSKGSHYSATFRKTHKVVKL